MRFLVVAWVLLGFSMLHGADRSREGRFSLDQLYKDYASEADLQRLLAEPGRPSPLHEMLREKTEAEKLRDLGFVTGDSRFSTSPCMQYMVLMELTVLRLVAESEATRDACSVYLVGRHFPLVGHQAAFAFSMLAASPLPPG